LIECHFEERNMADIATTLGPQARQAETSDATILTFAAAGILAVLLIMVAMLPFDAAPNPDSGLMLFVP
jgi:hypothetical protein